MGGRGTLACNTASENLQKPSTFRRSFFRVSQNSENEVQDLRWMSTISGCSATHVCWATGGRGIAVVPGCCKFRSSWCPARCHGPPTSQSSMCLERKSCINKKTKGRKRSQEDLKGAADGSNRTRQDRAGQGKTCLE